MKKLTRMKLINWHRFENCTLDFGSATLISGENGAGKSTLLDAIQFVITCSAGSFNKAAHENGKRKLTGYIRCKTGRENKPYERTGQVSAHVALEFYEESRDSYFIIGAVVDSASEGQETTVRYLIDKARLDDSLFFSGSQPRSISQFRQANKNIRQCCKTQAEAKKMIKSRLGRIQDKFFTLIPKALAFKPIDDIKDFVYSYVLDQKEVNIDTLRENVRAYQDLERTLESVRTRMAKLEQIEKYHDEVLDCMRRDKMYEYFLTRVDIDLIREKQQQTASDIRTTRYKQGELTALLKEKGAEKNRLQDMETSLRVELSQNQEFLALEEQRRLLGQLQAQEQEHLSVLKELKTYVRRAMSQAEQLLTVSDVDPCIREYRDRFRDVEKITDVASAKELVEQVISYKGSLYDQLQRRMAELRIHLRQQEEEYNQLQQRIADLERKKLSYPDAVVRLNDAIRQEFAAVGRNVSPHILCELLEIRDESWRNAVEGYLNTQRFYILVEPENFDLALSVYDRLRREKKAYGVGLINTRNMKEYDTAPSGTLAEVVTTRNKYARRYINMVLGKVTMCDRYEELKKYPISITRECMRYQNRVASAIKPEIFRVPFIGRQALKVQLEQARIRQKEQKQAMDQLREKLTQIEQLLPPLSPDAERDIKYHLDVLTRLTSVRASLAQCAEHIRTLERNTTILQKQIRLQEITKEREQLEADIARVNRRLGSLENTLREKQEQLTRLQSEINEKEQILAQLAEQADTQKILWDREYEKLTGKRGLQDFQETYERQRRSNETRLTNVRQNMIDWMIRYKTEHDFGAAPSMEGYPEFAAVYDRLRTSELLEYETKVQAAKAAAEEEFREQFLARLQENMKQAQSEFRDLNKALKDITFSNERYEFLFMPSKRNRSYYEMIMDDFNVISGESIFSGIFHETHKAVIDELFEKLAINNDNNAKTLDELTDYRTYMDYDIRILHADGSYSFYSKVCEEKSGGETQTPFYVTVAASFVQLYTNSIGGEAAGLVLFDEAFNNMDDERIGGVLKFFNRLPLQIIIAAPPEKIQFIGPEMSQILLAMTDEKVGYVEEYSLMQIR